MFLVVSGPASTGKTTLINELMGYTEYIKSIVGVDKVVAVKETAREIFEEEFGDKYNTFEELVNDDLDIMRFQGVIARRQIEEFRNKYIPDDSTLYILDRGPIDTMIYTALNYHNLKSNVIKNFVRDTYQENMDDLFNLFCESLGYGEYFHTSASDEYNIEDDGFRPMSYLNRRSSELIAFDISRRGYKLPSDTEDRVHVILDNLKINYNK